MTKPKHSLDYHACTIVELQRFIKIRTGQGAKSKQKKPFYIDILRQADHNAVFRFLGLPPEMRNLVYRELLGLTYGDDKSPCYPQILAASKHIHREAESILYGDSPVEIKLYFDTRITPWHDISGSWYAVVDTQHYEKESLYTLDDAFDNWPAFLRKMHHVHIEAIFGTQTILATTMAATRVRRTLTNANHTFYTLAAHLAGSNQLKGLTLRLEGDDIADLEGRVTPEFKDMGAAVLAPFAKLLPGLSDSLFIEGAPAKATDELLKQLRMKDTAQAMTVRECKSLLHKATHVRIDANIIDYGHWWHAVDEQLLKLYIVLDSMEYIDDHKNRMLSDAAKTLQQLLDGGML